MAFCNIVIGLSFILRYFPKVSYGELSAGAEIFFNICMQKERNLDNAHEMCLITCMQ